jgi:hypothetical protein
MEINLGQPSKVHEIDIGIDPVTKIETETDHVTKTEIETKTFEVKEVVSFIKPTPTGLESVSLTPQ